MSATPTDAVTYYSAVAPQFHESYKADANRLERLQVWTRYFDQFLKPPGQAYDLGCGSGILACELARRGFDVIGVDGAAGMLEIARRTASDLALETISFQQHRLPIENTSELPSADIVISSSALEYLESMLDAVKSVHDMLKPGGLLIFSVSNYNSISRRAVRLVHSWTGKPIYFGLLKQFMTVDQVYTLLESSGFEPLKHSYFARADRVNKALGTILPEKFSSNMIIIAARRR